MSSLACIVFAFMASCAHAHDHAQYHAFYQNWTNREGKGCCNDRDCHTLAAVDEREAAGVLEVQVEGRWCPIQPKHYLKSGNVPDASVAHICVVPKALSNKDPCERIMCYQPRPLT